MEGIYVDSEIGPLEKVLVHSPGREIQDVTPETAERLLYNDILPLSVVADEHRRMKELLQRVCRVYEFGELLEQVLQEEDSREEALKLLLDHQPVLRHRAEELEALDGKALARILIHGLKIRPDTLTRYLSEDPYDLVPLPNTYFTRDSAFVFRDQVISGAMANGVRQRESLLAAFFFRKHPELANAGYLYPGHRNRDPEYRIEGGDFLVLDRNLICLGISSRTSQQCADRLIEALQELQRSQESREVIHLFAVILPPKRATIHLDMIFSQIDRHQAMVFEPLILSRNRCRVVRISLNPGQAPRLRECGGLLEGLKEIGVSLEPVLCGGRDPVRQEREQWLSGNNFFALAPGKIIGYGCNTATMEALAEAGFTVRSDRDFLEKGDSLDRYDKLAIGLEGVELARGGGGLRCMTMPLKRQPYSLFTELR